MEPWSLAVPDWRERIRTGRSLLPDLSHLDQAQAGRAIAIFNKLRLPDVIGTPALAEAGYRAGALVFGGGHVVLPLLERAFVPSGWVPADQFLAGYALAQAVPGPLFTFGAFLGAASGGVLGGAAVLVAIFLPGLLLMAGALPFWDGLRRRPDAQAALRGVNAAVVGILLAALFDPIWQGSVHMPADFALVLAAFVALVLWKAPPWAVVVAAAAAGALMGV